MEPAAQPAPGSEPGDFTRMFQLRQAPEPVAVPTPKPSSVPATTSQPGEFTRAFQKPAMAPSVAPAGSPTPGQPGEFTRMFQQPVPAAAPPVSPPVSEAPDNPVPAPPAPASKPWALLVVIAVVLLSAIAVFLLMRRIY